mmetsp:Transcript_114928/g.246978  ORF Transcript_114928/g.246978 Transcript_114928/m.246978 type:complete len:94 (-) Transcript_114928:78-359(-)
MNSFLLVLLVVNLYFLVRSLQENNNYKDFIVGKKARSSSVHVGGLMRMRIYYDHTDMFRFIPKPVLNRYWVLNDTQTSNLKLFYDKVNLVETK